MGALCSKDNPVPVETANNGFATDDSQPNARQGKREELKLKLLLLGPGGSGKSTIFKQFRILYGTEKTDDDLRMHGAVARSNVITAVRKLCLLVRDLGYEERLDEESATQDVSGITLRGAYDQIISYLVENSATEPFPDIPQDQQEEDWVGRKTSAGDRVNKDAYLFLQHVEAIRVFWQSNTIQDVWMKRALANIEDAHKEFFTDIARISSPQFKPTQNDILISRVRTTQPTVEKYTIDRMKFEIYDAGGQRPERGKWIPLFQDVNAVIFVAALSEYDQVLAEARRQNRMIEALKLFESIVKNDHFVNSTVMLFLNKKDVFAEKIKYSDIAAIPHFKDYAGPRGDYVEGVNYFVEKFAEIMFGEQEDLDNDCYIHITHATDTQNMEFVLDASRDIILAENLNKLF